MHVIMCTSCINCLSVSISLFSVQIGTQWHRYFCQFRKKDIAGKKIRQVRFLPIGHQGNVRDHLLYMAASSHRIFHWGGGGGGGAIWEVMV